MRWAGGRAGTDHSSTTNSYFTTADSARPAAAAVTAIAIAKRHMMQRADWIVFDDDHDHEHDTVSLPLLFLLIVMANPPKSNDESEQEGK